MKNIVAVVAHPDDIAYGMGGTAWLLRNNYKLHVLCATRGERGVPGQDMNVTAAIREKEEAAACELLGAELTFLDRIDADLFADREICEHVAALIRQIQPVAVFTLWPVDTHPDHSAASEIAKKAVKLADSPAEFYYTEASFGTQTTQFVPDIYVDISNVIDDKTVLMRCHVCQNTDDFLVRLHDNQCRFRGKECGCKCAEGFKTVKPVNSATKSILLGLGC